LRAKEFAVGSVELDHLFFEKPDGAMIAKRKTATAIKAIANQDGLAAILQSLDCSGAEHLANMLANEIEQI